VLRNPPLTIHKTLPARAKSKNVKKYLTIVTILISINIFGQNLDHCGINDEPKLTQTESEFLNEYMTDYNRQNFDFTNKKVIFITGNSGHQFGTKSEYFDKIRERNGNADKIATWVVKLTEEEQFESGYDVIVTYWVKVLTNRQKRKILKEKKAIR
jgi:hypothetical protein